jgi:hypothetical protein
MAELVFDVIGSEADRYAAGPTLQFILRIAETTGVRVHAIALRIQMRIEPKRRRYSAAEAERLLDLFGETKRWGDTVKPMQFAFADVMVPGFDGSIEVEVPIPCTYDLEVASAKYFHALDEGNIPFLMLFSGTVFTRGESGFSVEQVPWHKEVSFGMPVKVWDEMMDLFFPGQAWLRIQRETLDDLQRFKSQRALTGWDVTLKTLLGEVSAENPAPAGEPEATPEAPEGKEVAP